MSRGARHVLCGVMRWSAWFSLWIAIFFKARPLVNVYVVFFFINEYRLSALRLWSIDLHINVEKSLCRLECTGNKKTSWKHFYLSCSRQMNYYLLWEVVTFASLKAFLFPRTFFRLDYRSFDYWNCVVFAWLMQMLFAFSFLTCNAWRKSSKMSNGSIFVNRCC